MIDEKKLIEILSKNSIFEKITNAEGKNVFEIIEEQPKVNEWISCSERMPSEKESWYFNDEEGIYIPNEFIVQVKGAEVL